MVRAEARQEGAISFVKHAIMGDFSTKNAGDVTFSELHGVTFGDLDGDGIPDLITGKRVFSHLESYLDPDPYGAAVLYWYRTVRNPKAEGGAEFIPELIHNRSGVGSHLQAVDIDHDGALDLVTSTNRGTFIFWNKMRAAKGGGDPGWRDQEVEHANPDNHAANLGRCFRGRRSNR